MAEIHDKRDQLIQALAGLQATIWIGLFSVGFWPARDCWKTVFWVTMAVCTLAMVWQFVVLISCYYCFRAIDSEKMCTTDGKRDKWSKKSNFWRPIWNTHWIAFIIGILTASVSSIARFLG